MYFVGIDLAWSVRNGSGIVILKGNRSKAEFVCGDVLYSDKEIIDYINKTVKDKEAFVAIDAPLIVPNEQGRRRAEELTGFLFRKYNAGAHPANRTRLSSWTGSIRGEDLSKKLEENGFEHSPYIEKFEMKRKFFEVYPHPSMVVLFNLDLILRYKNKPKRDYNFRWNEFEKYQTYLRKLEKSKPKLILPKEIVKKKVRNLRGNALKSYEDLLDAVFCAYIAQHSWHYPKKNIVLGSMEEGYILTPVFEHMHEQLKEYISQKSLKEF